MKVIAHHDDYFYLKIFLFYQFFHPSCLMELLHRNPFQLVSRIVFLKSQLSYRLKHNSSLIIRHAHGKYMGPKQHRTLCQYHF